MLTRERRGNIVLEPLDQLASTADQAQALLEQAEQCAPRNVFAQRSTVTVRCYRNELMTREFADELYRLVTEEYDVPVLRVVGPTPSGADHLLSAASAAGRPKSVLVFTHDGARTASDPCTDLGEYMRRIGY